MTSHLHAAQKARSNGKWEVSAPTVRQLGWRLILKRQSYVSLGAHVSMPGSTEEDTSERSGKDSTAYPRLGKFEKTICRSTSKTKIKIFMSNVIFVLLSDCQTWKMIQTHKRWTCSCTKGTGKNYYTYLGPTISDGNDCLFLWPPPLIWDPLYPV